MTGRLPERTEAWPHVSTAASGMGDYECVVDLEPPQFADLDLRDVVQGRVAILRRALQEMALYDEVVSSSAAAVEAIGGSEAREQVEKVGFERLHDALDPAQVFQLRLYLSWAFEPLSVRAVRGFLDTIGRPSRAPYAERQTYVRIMMPEDVVAAERELLADQFGHMVVHNPHRDSWFSHCLNTINIWIAIGGVDAENGLLIYPDVWGRRLEREGTSVARAQPVGVPIALPLEPGDALVFSGEHLHSSALNVTDKTRYVASFRITYGAPRYGAGIGWVPYEDLRLVGTRLERMAALHARLTRAYVRHRRRGREAAR